MAEIAGILKVMASDRDAILLSKTDSVELETVRKNFEEKKLVVDNKEKGAFAVKRQLTKCLRLK